MKTAALATAITVALIACGSSQKDPTIARSASYSGDFQALFQDVAVTVKKEYPNIAAKPAERLVATAWHPLPLSEKVTTREDTPRYDREETEASGQSNSNFDQRRAFRQRSTNTEKRYFVRFDVRISAIGAPGGNQWKVEVSGQASEWDGTAAPMPLKGAERPYWLDKRIDSLQIAIYEKLRGRAVAAPSPAPAP